MRDNLIFSDATTEELADIKKLSRIERLEFKLQLRKEVKQAKKAKREGLDKK